jgi:hypothetical protein
MSPAMEDLDAVDDTPAVLVLFSSLKAALPALEKLQTPAAQENSSASLRQNSAQSTFS